MYYVMYGEYGECYGEYSDYETACEIADRLLDRGEDCWICSDEE